MKEYEQQTFKDAIEIDGSFSAKQEEGERGNISWKEREETMNKRQFKPAQIQIFSSLSHQKFFAI